MGPNFCRDAAICFVLVILVGVIVFSLTGCQWGTIKETFTQTPQQSASTGEGNAEFWTWDRGQWMRMEPARAAPSYYWMLKDGHWTIIFPPPERETQP